MSLKTYKKNEFKSVGFELGWLRIRTRGGADTWRIEEERRVDENIFEFFRLTRRTCVKRDQNVDWEIPENNM